MLNGPSQRSFVPADAEAELFWLAFRYVSGELPAEDAMAFEERLLADESACSAVARGVELSQAVRLAESAATVVPGREWPGGASSGRQSEGRIVSACLMLAVVATIGLGAFFAGRRSNDVAGPSVEPSAGVPVALAGELISRWRESGDPTVIESDPIESDPGETPVDGWGDDADDHPVLGAMRDSDAKDERNSGRGGAPISVPAWMLAAVTAAHTDATPEPSGEDKP